MMEIYNEAVRDEVHANCDVVQDDLSRFTHTYFGYGPRYGCVVSETDAGVVVGWGALKTFSSRPRDESVAEVAVYITRTSRSAGLGIRMLERLMVHARSVRFHSLVAIILGKNTPSIRGSKYCGFEEKVRLTGAARVQGEVEDIVWLQLVLS